MKILLVFLTVLLVSVNMMEILESDLLQRKLLYYMPSIKTEKIPLETIGVDLVRYGYVMGCDEGKNEIDLMNKLTGEKGNNDVRKIIGKFYEFYIIPYGDYDNTIWYMFVHHFPNFDLIWPNRGLYELNQYRNCDQKETQCRRYLPSRPRNLNFNERQCKRALLFINEFEYRDETSVLPVHYYALSIYVLSKINLPRENLGNQDQDEKLFEMKSFLNKSLRKNKIEYQRQFIKFLNFRNEKLELTQKDLEECAISDRRTYIEEELKFHKLVTNMMVQGWMIGVGATPTDGKFEMTDRDGKKYVFDVPPIADFDRKNHQ